VQYNLYNFKIVMRTMLPFHFFGRTSNNNNVTVTFFDGTNNENDVIVTIFREDE
jgi:hypothetical protein